MKSHKYIDGQLRERCFCKVYFAYIIIIYADVCGSVSGLITISQDACNWGIFAIEGNELPDGYTNLRREMYRLLTVRQIYIVQMHIAIDH